MLLPSNRSYPESSIHFAASCRTNGARRPQTPNCIYGNYSSFESGFISADHHTSVPKKLDKKTNAFGCAKHLFFIDMLAVLLPLVLASLILAGQDTRQYTIYNKCPTAIDLYIGGTHNGTIPIGENVSRNLSTTAGYFFTDANGGSQNGNRTTRAGFADNGFYYIIRDNEHANTGLQVKPTNHDASDGFCDTVQCDDYGCRQALPGFPKIIPDPRSTPPDPPYHRCNYSDTDFDITFCPTGNFPDQGQEIRFDYTQDKCLTVQGSFFANGTPVQISQCSGSQAQLWMIQRGSTKVRLAKTNSCLDAGTNPANGDEIHLWECYDNLPAQQWTYNDDNHIELENQGFCMDLDNGILTTTYKVQAWMCADNNNNQVWSLT